MKAWTMGYFPFTMGGSVNRPIIADIKVEGPIPLGQGLLGYLATSPTKKKTIVVEGLTGAVVGDSYFKVVEDVRTASLDVIADQLTEAVQRVKTAEEVSEDKFWQMIDFGIL